MWRASVGDAGRSVSIETFGIPASADQGFEHFGIDTERRRCARVDGGREGLIA